MFIHTCKFISVWIKYSIPFLGLVCIHESIQLWEFKLDAIPTFMSLIE